MYKKEIDKPAMKKRTATPLQKAKQPLGIIAISGGSTMLKIIRGKGFY